MWGYHPVPARREFAILNTFVKQGKTIFQIPVLLLFSLLFTPETQAMPRKPQTNHVSKKNTIITPSADREIAYSRYKINAAKAAILRHHFVANPQ